MNQAGCIRTEALMGTLVTIQVVSPGSEDAIDRAFGWFRQVEARCTRFDERSELMQLTARVGEPVPASTILFQAIRFALAVAEESGGAFDPTIGHHMMARGYDKEHRTGRAVMTAVRPDSDVTYRDVEADPDRQTITLRRPLLFDLGAVAKGLAVDTAAQELSSFGDFAIDAGGDLYLGGCNPNGEPWSAGIRHPLSDGQIIETLRLSDRAICTSGDYERPDHLVDPRSGDPARAVASATVIARSAMLADGLATAAFVLGPAAGIELLERHGVEGLILTPELDRYESRGFPGAR